MEEYLAGNLVTKTFNQQQNAKKQLMLLINNIIVPLKSTVSKFAIYPAIRFINQLAFIISAILGAMLVFIWWYYDWFLASVFAIYQPNF